MCYTQDIIKTMMSALRIFTFKHIAYCMTRASFIHKILLWSAIVLFSCICTSSAYPHPDYLGTKNKPRMIRDQFCGAYVAWHALRYYGLNTHIDKIVKSMQIHPIKGTSIAEVITVLKKYDLAARAVKIRPEKINILKQPFILYIPSIENTKQGHFVFCIHSGLKKCVVLDGINGPNVIALDILKRVNENISQEIALILLEDSKKTAIGVTWIKYRSRICEAGGTFLLTCLIWIIYKFYFRETVSKRGWWPMR